MVDLRPPWAKRRERCPRCLGNLADDRAYVCDRCGYQLRLPRVSLAGLTLIGAALAAFFVSVFGGYLFPWPAMPFPIPFLESPTPADLESLFLWVGVILLLVGIATALAGAYAIRRKGERASAEQGPPA